MAKLCLIFLVFCIIVQVALAASRYPRDTAIDADSTGIAEPTDLDPAKTIGKMFDQVKQSVEKVMSKENMDKVMGTLAQVGDQLKNLGQDMAKKIASKE